jgi:retinol dehydrogenase 14
MMIVVLTQIILKTQSKMTDKIFFVTGSSDGIGKATAAGLAQTGATILLHARTEEKALHLIEELRQQVPQGKFDVFHGDFSILNDVKTLAEAVQEKYPRIDVLINNAGVFSEKRVLTTDGFELTFQVNYLSPFLLTTLLLPALKKADEGRIVNVSSMTHQSARFDLSNLQGEKNYEGYSAYSCSKLANVLFTVKLAEELESDQITVNALHPGVINTKLLKAAMGSSGGSTNEQGAQTSIFLATAPDIKNITGKYFVDSAERKPSPASFDKNLQNDLWSITEKILGRWLA